MSEYDFKSTTFELKGFKHLYRALDALPQTFVNKELAPLLALSLEPMRDTARYLAPNDPLTGPPWDLPSSIEVSTRQATGRSRGGKSLGRFDARAYMGPTKYGYPQAMMQEFGTIHHVATPYMRPAWENDKHKALDIIRAGLGARLEMVIKKYGIKA